MSNVSRRAARAEQRCADLLGGERVTYRPRHVSAPDVRPIRMGSGDLLQLEVKSTKRPPKRLLGVLAQAAKYAPGAIPVGVFVPFGGEPIAVLSLEHLARLVGIREPCAGEQLALLGRAR